MIDYRKILAGYISGVLENEGVDYVKSAQGLTHEEKAALYEVAAECDCTPEYRATLLRWAADERGKDGVLRCNRITMTDKETHS